MRADTEQQGHGDLARRRHSMAGDRSRLSETCDKARAKGLSYSCFGLALFPVEGLALCPYNRGPDTQGAHIVFLSISIFFL